MLRFASRFTKSLNFATFSKQLSRPNDRGFAITNFPTGELESAQSLRVTISQNAPHPLRQPFLSFPKFDPGIYDLATKPSALSTAFSDLQRSFRCRVRERLDKAFMIR